MSVFFKIENKKIEMLTCNLDKATDRLLSLSPATIEKENIELVNRFLMRQIIIRNIHTFQLIF